MVKSVRSFNSKKECDLRMALIKVSGTLIGQKTTNISWNIKTAQTKELVNILKETFPASYMRFIDNTDEFKPFINVFVNQIPVNLTKNSVFLEHDEILMVGSIA